MHPVIVLILVVAALLALSWIRRRPAVAKQRLGFQMALVAAGLLLVFAVLSGKLNPLLALVFAAIPLMQRLMGAKQLLDRLKSAHGPTPGRVSTVKTRFVEMRLEHDSGDMSGTILEGPFAGRALSALGVEQLAQTLDRWRTADAQSAALLEAYLDRVHGTEWRRQAGRPGDSSSDGGPAPAGAPMSEVEAREILGVSSDASREEIVDAHRRLMQKLHPDRGGSTYLAAKVNRAKELLLKNA